MEQNNTYQRLIFPLLTRIDAETAHERTIAALARAQRNAAGRAFLRRLAGDLPQQPVDLFGLTFPNVLGVAAGFDKNIQVVDGLGLLGFGHIEVGTVTPQPQAGNPRPRVFRLVEDGAIINRMGFPSDGMDAARERLAALQTADRPYVLGISLGKQKETSLIQAANDYVAVLHAVYPHAGYLAVNISSPNTPELRDLQGRAYLGDLLGTLTAASMAQATAMGIAPRPLLVKIAPDLSRQELDDILQVALDHNIAGIIATNTTIGRDGLRDPNREQVGGLSGQPLGDRSLEIIRVIARATNGTLPIIGVGGIRTADDVRRRLDAGASLIQIYTAMVYEGPGLAGRILRELSGQEDGS